MQTIKFKDFVVLQRGFDLPRRKRTPGNYPVVAASSVVDTHNEYKVESPGVTTGRSGSLGTVQYVERDFWPLNTTLWVRDFQGNHPRYVYYFLKTLDLERFDAGASVPTLNRNHLDELEIRIHSLPTQRKIAAVLYAYDDLIESNTRRIAILEEMAQLLYREWFVRFRFPGHEDLEMVKAPEKQQKGSISPVSGNIPDGWEIKSLEQCCDLTLGVSPKSEYYNEKEEGLPFHQGVSDFGDVFPETTRYCTKKKRIAEEGDILFSVRAPVGRINVADRRIIIGRGLHAIRSKSGHQFFTLLQLKEKFKEEDQVGSGTIFKSVTKRDMLGIQFLIPPTPFLDNFEDLIGVMYAEIKNLTRRNAVLSKARNFLLPRLISGQIILSG